jgi:hypothetical protein
MNEQSNEVKWIPINLLSDQVKQVEKNYGNYSVAVLSNGSKVVIDNKNFKALVPTGNRPYTLAKDFEKWLNRGFIVISLLHKRLSNGSYYRAKHSHNDKHYVLNAKDGSVVCVGHIFDSDVEKFLLGDSDYFIVQNIQKKFAIFNKDGQQISDWFDNVYPYGFVYNQSDYYIAKRDGKLAIFYKDGKQVTDWFDWIGLEGLVYNQTNYYIAGKDNKYAIFHKSGEQISDWFDDIYPIGLVFGDSDYYIAWNNRKYAIFHKDGRQISDWFNWIYPGGLVEDQSDFYIVKKNRKETILNKDGQQVIGWYDHVYPDGLVKGESDYYVVKDHQKAYIGKLGSSKLLGPYWDFGFWGEAGVISDPSSDSITVRTLDSKVLNISKTDIEKFFEDKEVEDGRAK